MSIVPLEERLEAGKRFVNEHRNETGCSLPLTDKVFKEYFPIEQSFLLTKTKSIVGILSYRSGRDKQAPIAWLRVLADTPEGLKTLVRLAENTALTQEKIDIRTNVFGYDSKKLSILRTLGYKVGATIPGAVSFDGSRHDYHFLHRQLVDKYRFPVKRGYAKPGMYPKEEVERPKNVSLKVRGYRKEDRPILDKFATQNNVIRGLGSGVFPGLYPWVPGYFDQLVDSGRMVPLVCEDETTKQPVGILDLSRHLAEAMQHTAMLGMYVKAEYQGMGAGTKLMDSMKTLAQRMHLARVWLSVFEGNTPAERLYRRSGFEESGSIPGYLQEGYVNENFMTLKLD